MKKNTNKVINASLGMVMAVSGAASSVAPVSVYAETVKTPEKGFAITDSKTGSPVALGEDTVIKVYTDSSKNKELDGAAKIEGNRIVFTPAGALDDTSEFYFSIEVLGYEEAFGGPFTFVTGDVDVAIKKITPENITFTIADGTAITDNDIVFKKDGQKLFRSHIQMELLTLVRMLLETQLNTQLIRQDILQPTVASFLKMEMLRFL